MTTSTDLIKLKINAVYKAASNNTNYLERKRTAVKQFLDSIDVSERCALSLVDRNRLDLLTNYYNLP